MQSVTLEPLEAIALAAAGVIGALAEGHATPDSQDKADELRHDAVALLLGTGMTPMQVIELGLRVAYDAGDVTFHPGREQ